MWVDISTPLPASDEANDAYACGFSYTLSAALSTRPREREIIPRAVSRGADEPATSRQRLEMSSRSQNRPPARREARLRCSCVRKGRTQ